MPLDEVTTALEKKRHELVLSGPTASKIIEEEGLDQRVYQCQSLNFLDITNTCLSGIGAEVSQLCNLTNLVLRGNQLTELPVEIGQLTKLKLVDISRNKITTLPDDICNLKQLQSLNASFNQLETIPNITDLENLSILDLSHNQLKEFPFTITDADKLLIHLSELLINDNQVENVPPESGKLPSVKVLDLCNNKLACVPGELGDCLKLKEVRLKGNKLKDRRLLKLVDQCHYKQVLEYIRCHCQKSAKDANTEPQPAKGKSKGKKKKGASENKDAASIGSVKVIHVKDDTPVIKCTEAVKDVRPHIIGVIVRNVDLQDASTFKKFITLQTKLHDTICEKRNTATIATHDLSKINGNLLYDARDRNEIMIQPLMRNKPVSTAALFQQLCDEAEALRKEKKRNTYSGIHKYLYLLDHKTAYPYLSDNSGAVISFPPITNSDLTKIGATTTDLLMEVTSSVNLGLCKQVMDNLILEMIKADIATKTEEDNSKTMVVEQVRVEDKDSNLKVVYPSRTDLNCEEINVIHQ